ncbi:hypothetical protein H257_17412 [Aphanomyces astaci]|uniref:Uncharacterized protein n=1 Tax=Aphanomyces astaci TaxID=112090 RepID=W4FES2_APHAT|nr:hypothetical protein H257_17412 [Aphanomyces astaci]ETV65992.1 hypothetical protein H257_17412 [Aphanomyces astaci]|eukprot:XP_009844511.1 hypothetical protein H257_17412 [Aphanomyces astaci]
MRRTPTIVLAVTAALVAAVHMPNVHTRLNHNLVTTTSTPSRSTLGPTTRPPALVHNRTQVQHQQAAAVAILSSARQRTIFPILVVDDSLYTCKVLPKICQVPSDDVQSGDVCRFLFPDCYGAVAHRGKGRGDGVPDCDTTRIAMEVDVFPCTVPASACKRPG